MAHDDVDPADEAIVTDETVSYLVEGVIPNRKLSLAVFK